MATVNRASNVIVDWTGKAKGNVVINAVDSRSLFQMISRDADGQILEIIESPDLWMLREFVAAMHPTAGRVVCHLLSA